MTAKTRGQQHSKSDTQFFSTHVSPQIWSRISSFRLCNHHIEGTVHCPKPYITVSPLLIPTNKLQTWKRISAYAVSTNCPARHFHAHDTKVKKHGSSKLPHAPKSTRSWSTYPPSCRTIHTLPSFPLSKTPEHISLKYTSPYFLIPLRSWPPTRRRRRRARRPQRRRGPRRPR